MSSSEHVVLDIRVVVRSSKSEIVGLENGVLRVRIASPPVDGAANKELVKLLAKSLGVARGSVAIISGETSRTKRVRIDDISAAELQRLLST